MKSIYKLSEIKPVGNFELILEHFNKRVSELEAEKKYTPAVAKNIILFVGEMGVIKTLEKFETPYNGWNFEEQKMCLLYATIILIRLNNIAQEYMNHIKMAPIHEQLMESINDKKHLKSIFGKLVVKP